MTGEPQAQPRFPEAALPSAERLVNLTAHPVTVESQTPDPVPEESAPGEVTFPSDGPAARVPEERASPGGDETVRTQAGLLRETRLRRHRLSPAGLPPAVPGVRYLVSRITAEAARDRADLVFPFGEQRDSDGNILRVSGLGSFVPARPSRAVADWSRARVRAARSRRTERPLGAEWVTGLLFAFATALLSAWLGLLPGGTGTALTNGWGVTFLVLGALAFAWAARRWVTGQRIRADRGTAYVIEEVAIAWVHEEKQWVLDQLDREFAEVLRVPGPDALGERWRWEADERGAPQWGRRTDQLVYSFWAVHYNDDPGTRNAVFVWAPWPVALAFGARATAKRRGLALHVRQRPSSGATGSRHELRSQDPAYDFARRPAPEAGTRPVSRTLESATLRVRVRPLGTDREENRVAFPPVRLLLVRIVQQDIGGIRLDLGQSPEIELYAPRCLTGQVLRPGLHENMEVAEWRWQQPGASAEIPWKDFPGTVDDIADWIIAEGKRHEGHVLLLATRMPQEIAVGLGIQLGQRRPQWPRRLYPVHFTGGKLIVPDLDLGRDSVPAERG